MKKSLVDKVRYLEGMCEDTRVGGADYKVGSAMVLRPSGTKPTATNKNSIGNLRMTISEGCN